MSADALIGAELDHRFSEASGTRIHYVTRGEGKPILFMHGFPQFWFLWRNQLADLGEDHAVFAPDLRGFNLSDKPEDVEAYRMRHLLGDLKGLVEELGIAPFTLVGHDWGGIVSWAFALKYPELLERFVILDSPPPFTWNRDLRESPKQREAVNYMLELSKPPPEPERLVEADDFAMLDSMLERIGSADARLSDEERAAYHEAWGQPGAHHRRAQLLPRRPHGRPGRRRRGTRGVRGEDRRDAARGPDAGDLGRARPGSAGRPHARPREVDPRHAAGDPARCRVTGCPTSARTRSTA